jgi:hypothetical protein
VRSFQSMLLMTVRWSLHWTPLWPYSGKSRSICCQAWSVISLRRTVPVTPVFAFRIWDNTATAYRQTRPRSVAEKLRTCRLSTLRSEIDEEALAMLGKHSDPDGGDHAHLDHVGRDSFYGFLALHREELFSDENFADLYCPGNGRPSVPPS